MSHKIKICLVGARGYVGKELIALLQAHPKMQLTAAFSRQLSGTPVFENNPELTYQESSPDAVAAVDADAYILALPNGYCEQYTSIIIAKHPEAVIIDLSSDKRFDPKWQYSVPELNLYPKLQYISNPGCYATAMQLGIAPFLNLLVGSVHCFGISGYSGAGTTPSDKNDPLLLKDNIIPYHLTDHVHEKEVTHALKHKVYFTPQVASFFRGIGMTIQAELKQKLSSNQLFMIAKNYYEQKPLIKVQQDIATLANNVGHHGAVVSGFSASKNSFALHVTLDNLLKGAATQAMQNLNIAFNFNSTLGIPHE